MNGENQTPVPDGQWQYKSSETMGGPESVSSQIQEPDHIKWTASEFIEHDKNIGWYVALVFAALLLSGAAYFMLKDLVAIFVIIAAAIIFGIAAVRKPRTLTYGLNSSGLSIGEKFHSYGEFKSFSIMEEGPFSSIMFVPLKRFMPPISIYYAPEDEDRIVEVLASYLPLENRKHDLFDQLVKRLRF